MKKGVASFANGQGDYEKLGHDESVAGTIRRKLDSFQNWSNHFRKEVSSSREITLPIPGACI
jgi:hypothetical protein